MAEGYDPLTRPSDEDVREWRGLDDDEKRRRVMLSRRPKGVGPNAWERMSPQERAARAMHDKTEEWDFRGGLSDMKQVGIEAEKLAVVAEVMTRLTPREFRALARRGYEAAGIVQ